MKNKQRGFLKILALVFPLVFIFLPSLSQTSTFRLKTADSLFRAKLYTQSLEHYEEILNQKQYTPSMLLKMAYIHEGLEHIGKAMYYLNLYFLATQDESAMDKIQELATKYNLEGYETSQTDRLLLWYNKNHTYLSLAIAAFMIFILSLAFYTKKRLMRRPVASMAGITLVGAILFLHLYYGAQLTAGIVANPSTYIMSGPSAGASVIEIVGDGHRVEVLGHHDVWLRVRWDGNTAYIRENSVLPVKL